ncbi:MAG TPA: carboxypeptidase-like regulatory domain-containing protein, partial [Puia sp.]|nr:carboxypeptidase-like regulatory domain-containing protein [Puia sp.]
MKVVLAALLTLLLLVQPAFAQKRSAFISGRVLDENDHPLTGVSVTILGRQSGIMTTDSGSFRIRIEADKALALVFSYTGYRTEQRNFLLNDKEEERVVVRMERGAKALAPVTVSDQQPAHEAGLIKVNPRDA